MIFVNKTSFKSFFLLTIIVILVISIAFFLYRYDSVTVNFFPQNSDLEYRGVFNNATSLAEFGNTLNSLRLTNISNKQANTTSVVVESGVVENNNTLSTMDQIVSLSNPVETLTSMMVNILENSSTNDTHHRNDIELKNYYSLGGDWNLKVRGHEFSNFTGKILVNNNLNNITKVYHIKLATFTPNNLTYQTSNQILKIMGTGDLTLDDQTDKIQLLIILYRNENIYVIFVSKTGENLFNSYIIDGNILDRKFEY